MPQPKAAEVRAKLRARYGKQAGTHNIGGGKNTMRRKKFRQKKSTNEFEKRLQANLKKLSCNTIPGIEEVNLFKSDGTVIHFVSPKVDAEVSSNTFIVSGNYTHNKIEELLPDILPQIGSDHLTQLKDYAEKFEALKPQNDDGGDEAPALVADGADDVPMLIDDDLNFEAVAATDEKDEPKAEADAAESTEVKDEPKDEAPATDAADKAKDEPAKEEAEKPAGDAEAAAVTDAPADEADAADKAEEAPKADEAAASAEATA